MMRLGLQARYLTLVEINRAAVTQPQLDKIFQLTCRAVRKFVPFDRMAFSLFRSDHSALRLTAVEGQGAQSFFQVGLNLDCENTHHGWVFQHQKPILRRDLQREVEFNIEEQNVKEGLRSYCAVPLIALGASVGVFIVLSSQRNSYSHEHAEFLREISDQFVLAIKSAIPTCRHHFHTNLVCPRCIASTGGRTTVSKYKEHLSDWGRQGGRGRKKPPAGFGDHGFRLP